MYIIYDDHYMYLANMTKINVLWKYICTWLKLQRFKKYFKNTSIKCMIKYEYMYEDDRWPLLKFIVLSTLLVIMILALLSSSVICHLHLLLRVGRFLTCRPTLLLLVPQLVSFSCPLHVVSGTVSFSFSPAPPAFYKSMSMRIKIKYMYHLHVNKRITIPRYPSFLRSPFSNSLFL